MICVSDRWAYHNGKRAHILVGEYKVVHKLRATKLRRVMSTHPGDLLFSQAAKEQVASASSSKGHGDAFVAQTVCQAYHYMIIWAQGLAVVSGDGLSPRLGK